MTGRKLTMVVRPWKSAAQGDSRIRAVMRHGRETA